MKSVMNFDYCLNLKNIMNLSNIYAYFTFNVVLNGQFLDIF